MMDKKRIEMLFDIRTTIAFLFAVYGTVCLIWGLAFDGPADRKRSGNINVNLWTGLAMLAFAAAFLAWVLWRPLTDEKPPKGEAAAEDDQGRRGSPSANR
jgi:hypothetical protein